MVQKLWKKRGVLIMLMRNEVDCRQCIFRSKCRDVDFKKPVKECSDFKDVHTYIVFKILPGASVWVARKEHEGWVVTEHKCVSIVLDDKRNITYQCDDCIVQDRDFGFTAFTSLRAAETILDLKHDWLA